MRHIKLPKPIECKKLRIVIPKQTVTGICYLRLGDESYYRKNVSNAELKEFVEMKHGNCDQCLTKNAVDVFASRCANC